MKTLGLDALPDAVIVVDTETTGLTRAARIVEIAAVTLERGEITDEWSTLVDPGMRIPYDAMRVHGITDAMVRGAPSAAEAFEALRARAAGRPAVMHNAAFDLRMFAQDAVRCRAEPPLVHALCTMKLARRVFVGVGSYGLGRLVHVLGINEDPTHRALTDARATARLYELIRAELAARG